MGNMKDWQKRVIDEQRQLAEKIFNLDMFFGRKHDDIAPNHLELLKKQLHTMKEYSVILSHRIADFTE